MIHFVNNNEQLMSPSLPLPAFHDPAAYFNSHD